MHTVSIKVCSILNTKQILLHFQEKNTHFWFFFCNIMKDWASFHREMLLIKATEVTSRVAPFHRTLTVLDWRQRYIFQNILKFKIYDSTEVTYKFNQRLPFNSFPILFTKHFSLSLVLPQSTHQWYRFLCFGTSPWFWGWSCWFLGTSIPGPSSYFSCGDTTIDYCQENELPFKWTFL